MLEAAVLAQDLQPRLIKTVGEVGALMARIANEKAEVVQPKAAAVAVDEAAAQAKVCPALQLEAYQGGQLVVKISTK